MVLVLYSIILIYVIAIGLLLYGFSKINTFDAIGCSPKTTFTIVVPFRDETESLPILLDSFSKLNYPKHLFEIILIDDDAVKKFQLPNLDYKISLIHNHRISNSPKKDAITTAVQFVTTEWIITTDADCVVPKNWLATLDEYIQNTAVSMIAGAVSYDCKSSFLHHFQLLDFTSLQGATIGSFGLGKGFMCNGANFAYTKSFFVELNGFKGNDTLASGDDVFLLQKAMAQFPEKVQYLKSRSTIVVTKPLNNWKSLFHQRLRWVSKTTAFHSSFGISLGIVVFLANLAWLYATVCLLLGLFSINEIMVFFLLKFLIEMVLFYRTNQFLSDTKIDYLLLGSLVYPFFSTGVALYSLFGKYEWKGRLFK